MVPFRESALRVVQLFISLLEAASQKKIDVSNKKRFKGEFGSLPDEKPPNLKRPEDYEAVFAGNIDDHFRIGIEMLPFPFFNFERFNVFKQVLFFPLSNIKQKPKVQPMFTIMKLLFSGNCSGYCIISLNSWDLYMIKQA